MRPIGELLNRLRPHREPPQREPPPQRERPRVEIVLTTREVTVSGWGQRKVVPPLFHLSVFGSVRGEKPKRYILGALGLEPVYPPDVSVNALRYDELPPDVDLLRNDLLRLLAHMLLSSVLKPPFGGLAPTVHVVVGADIPAPVRAELEKSFRAGLGTAGADTVEFAP
jgi:hypothetical protein